MSHELEFAVNYSTNDEVFGNSQPELKSDSFPAI